jgi:hypothetical protein
MSRAGRKNEKRKKKDGTWVGTDRFPFLFGDALDFILGFAAAAAEPSAHLESASPV